MISIIVPTYNKASILKTTIHELLKQTHKDIEIVVVNDSSSDNSDEIIKNIKNNKIKYIQHEQRLGATVARISGINKCNGEFIAFLDDDDVWNYNKLSLQNKILKKYSDLDFVMCDYVVNNQINNFSYTVHLNAFAENFKKAIVSGPGPFLQCCLFKNTFIKQHLALFDSLAEPSEDWDWFLSLSKNNPKTYNINSVLFQWNYNSLSQSSNKNKETAAIEYIINKHKKYILNSSSKNNLALQYRRIAGMYFENNNVKMANKYYNDAFAYNPLSIKNIVYKLWYCFK